MDWQQTIETIRIYAAVLHEIALEQVADQSWDPTEKAPATIAYAFTFACERLGLPEDEVRQAIDLHPPLGALYEAVTDEALLGGPDPGPYDVISRESSSGTPENRHIGWIGAMEVGAIPED